MIFLGNLVVFFLTLLIFILLLLSVTDEFFVAGPGQRAQLRQNYTDTEEKLDDLKKLALFPACRVRWHSGFFATFCGALISLACLQNMYPLLFEQHSFWLLLLIVFFPIFAIYQIIINFQSFHGFSKQHIEDTVRLTEQIRIDIKKNK